MADVKHHAMTTGFAKTAQLESQMPMYSLR